MTAFLGMRGPGSWEPNQVPESWAQFILHENPNGSAPMFALQSMFKEEAVDSHTYHWWTKTTPVQALTITAGSVYIDAGLATAYVYTTHQATKGIAEATVYVKVTEAFAKEVKPGHILLMRDISDTVDVVGRVIDIVYNGASSYLAVKLLEADDNGSTPASYNLSTVDRILISSNAYPDGSVAPEAITYNPVEYSNYVQNFRTTLDLTREAMAVALRTGDAYKEAKREIAFLHSKEIELAGFFGIKYSGTGENGQPLRTSQGIIPFLRENNPSNIMDFRSVTDSAYAGKTWLQVGKRWLDEVLTDYATYLPTSEVMCLMGNKASLGINDLADAGSMIQLTPGPGKSYGFDVTTWLTGSLKVHMKMHPLFSHELSNQNMMVLMLPENCKFCPLVGGGQNFNTEWEENMQIPGQHAKVDGYSTKGGWKFYHPNQFLVLRGIGEDNTVA
jgi:hypothetical protein